MDLAASMRVAGTRRRVQSAATCHHARAGRWARSCPPCNSVCDHSLPNQPFSTLPQEPQQSRQQLVRTTRRIPPPVSSRSMISRAPKCGQFAADLRVDLEVQHRYIWPFRAELYRRAAFCKAGDPAGALPRNPIAVRRIESDNVTLPLKVAFTGPTLNTTVAVISVGEVTSRGTDSRECIASDFGIVERCPDLFLRRGNALAVVHLHG